jgi:hypothetical protein
VTLPRFYLTPAIGVVLLLTGVREIHAFDLFGGKKEGGTRDQKVGLFPRRADTEASKSHLLQQEMMDYSDRFTMAVWQALDQYLRGETDPQKRSAAEHWKVLYSAATMQIAAGRDPAGSLLDMAVLTDLAEWSVSRSWNPQVFGKGGEPLLEALRGMKKDLGSILDATLTPSQRQQLNAIISDWKQRHPGSLYVAGIRLDDISSSRTGKETSKGGLILIADVSRAVGKVDEALQYGERAMFYLERLPRLTTMQTSLALAQVGSAPAVLSLSGSAEKAAAAITELPDKVTEAISTNAATVKELLPGIQGTVTESRKLAEAVDRTMNSSFFTNTTSGPSPWTPERTGALLGQVRDTLHEANQLSSSLGGGGNLVDAIFYRALIVVGVLIAGIAGLIVLFRNFPKR